MRKFRTAWKINLLLILLLLFGTVIFGQSGTPFSINESPLPRPATRWINDYAGVLDEATVERLDQRVKDFKTKTNPPVVLMVAIVKTTGEIPIFDYSLAVYRGWKIGVNADDSPGALLFIAVDDRKYFTQVGRDLEGKLPDGVAGQLQRQYLVPALKQGDYNKGVSDTIEAYIRTIEQRSDGTTTPTETEKDQPTGEKSSIPFSNLVCCLIILVIILFIIFSRSSNRPNRNDRNRWGGGGFGGGGGSSWIFLPTGGGWGSSDSSSSSSWGGGGSSDWGGFGGGDAGGGGAGGSW